MESVHILQYVVLTKSGIFWSTVEIHILCSCGSRGWADLPAVQSLRRGAWQEDTAGGDAIRLIDWIVSAPLLFSDQCPTIYHCLSACLFLLPLTPTSVSHFLLSFIHCVLPRAVSGCPIRPSSSPSLRFISLLAIYHPGPFKSIQQEFKRFAGQLRLDQVHMGPALVDFSTFSLMWSTIDIFLCRGGF